MLSVSDLSNGNHSVREVHHRLRVHRGRKGRAVPPMRHNPYASRAKFTGGTVHRRLFMHPGAEKICFGVLFFQMRLTVDR